MIHTTDLIERCIIVIERDITKLEQKSKERHLDQDEVGILHKHLQILTVVSREYRAVVKESKVDLTKYTEEQLAEIERAELQRQEKAQSIVKGTK